MSLASTLLQVSCPPVPQTPRIKSGRTDGLEAEMDSAQHSQEMRFPEGFKSPLGTENSSKTRRETGVSTALSRAAHIMLLHDVSPGGQICYLSPGAHSHGTCQASVFSPGKHVHCSTSQIRCYNEPETVLFSVFLLPPLFLNVSLES